MLPFPRYCSILAPPGRAVRQLSTNMRRSGAVDTQSGRQTVVRAREVIQKVVCSVYFGVPSIVLPVKLEAAAAENFSRLAGIWNA
ncbi:hypothetical protein DmAi_19550 [Acetobacter persici]|uniref:Uncharacterized protein n=1 Tax=Acetobacter persici TaxID=1076596 RepID=A0A6V8IBA7_9PROT|nr:hypothetical protein DmAi_19550 [Acetobacter persici]